jgi:hypothetical protein
MTLSVLRIHRVDDRLINEFGPVGGIRIGRGNSGCHGGIWGLDVSALALNKPLEKKVGTSQRSYLFSFSCINNKCPGQGHS